MRQQPPLLSLLALAQAVRGQLLPYNPTRILLHQNSTYAYVFGPSSNSPGQAQLSALDVTRSFDSGKPQLSTVSTALPFLQDGSHLPYMPMIDASGNITVLSGKCAEGSRDAQVWQFAPNTDHSSARGTWTQYMTMYDDSSDNADYTGPGYLSNSIMFSGGINGDAADSSIYVFGGMCPYQNSTPKTWISAADYSNSMLTISPDESNYEISLMDSRESPISQAGSTITPLPPTFGMNSSGGLEAQQQDFVLIGGNTQTAFINMSQVALFSLPQHSWSFVNVLQPTDGKTELTLKRATKDVTPRSGHTAVLSENGNSIILFGGWVGDVSVPAQPQLAVLELGDGYGGNGDWKWTIPEQSGDSLAPGTGIYGHGATMLPGGIMMVLGGYAIPDHSSSSTRYSKRAAQTSNGRMFLFNTTSNSWLQSYTPPLDLTNNEHGSSSPLADTSEKVGLATGLGIGAALLASMVGFYIWYGKRLKKSREERERALLAYSSDGTTIGALDQPFLPLHGGVDGRGANEAAFWPGREMSQTAYPRPPPMQHATGTFVNIPSPTRGLRKGSVARNYQYHAAPRYDDKRLSGASGNIHPIPEDENEDDHKYLAEGQTPSSAADAERRLREVERVLSAEDPFQDPGPNPLGSHPVPAVAMETVRRVPTIASALPSPIRKPVPRDTDLANWTIEGDRRNSVLEEQDAGFSWVNGDDRTSSTLSERSQHSTISNGTVTRTMSTKTGQLMAAAGAAHTWANSVQHSPTRERSSTVSSPTEPSNRASYFRTRARSSTNGSVPLTPGEDGESFKSAKSNVPHNPIQRESEDLMHGRSATIFDSGAGGGSFDDGPYQRAVAAHHSTRGRLQQPPTPLLAAAAPPFILPPRRRPGLMGSLRRALNAVSMGDRTLSLTGLGPGEGQDEDGIRTSSSSPTKDRASQAGGSNPHGPRRAVSDGGALLRHVRGQRDWDENVWPPYRDDPTGGDWGEVVPPPRSSEDRRQAEEDWDVEGAATNRDFQVLFSVPKSRLRVVNDDMDRASLRSASDGAVSRNGSIRREGSIKPLKMRKDGENARLPSTTEEAEGLEKEKAI